MKFLTNILLPSLLSSRPLVLILPKSANCVESVLPPVFVGAQDKNGFFVLKWLNIL